MLSWRNFRVFAGRTSNRKAAGISNDFSGISFVSRNDNGAELCSRQQILEAEIYRATEGRKVIIFEPDVLEYQHQVELFRRLGFTVDGAQDLSDIVSLVRHSSVIDLLVIAADRHIARTGAVIVDLCKLLHPRAQILLALPSDSAVNTSEVKSCGGEALTKPMPVAAVIAVVLKLFNRATVA
ncbi:hypothetical protein NCCP691_39120 [Noviherbaspirillum aridicola]|uniref:Response regulatory domain-containing protein n=1 Tax=Noviherbaspirillum aridicola TaxID=2849687 RepID=A0ABQ4Q9K1_9BURK|nr:hypothetical protein NCCP691_39120 [Noviherbaspirillum aridicola]